MARVEQSGVERDQRQEEIDRERFAAAEDHDVDAALRQLQDLTERAPQDPDADWYDQLEGLYETYADAWEESGRLDTRLTDGQGNTFTLGEYLATQRGQMEMRRNVRRTLGTIDGILSTTDVGDVEALQALADDPATADLPITVAGPDGEPVQTTVGAYLTDTLIPHTRTRLATDAALSEVNSITEAQDAGDVEALQALADDPATADLPITVAGPDGEPVQTTVGDYITNTLIPQTQVRASIKSVEELSEADDIAGLQALADDPASASQTVTITGDDGEPKEITLAEYITEYAIPGEHREVAFRELDEAREADDIEKLEGLAADPRYAGAKVTLTGDVENDPAVQTAKAAWEAAGSPESGPEWDALQAATDAVPPRELTFAEYITEYAIPAERRQKALETDVPRLQRVADRLTGVTGSRYLNTARAIARAYASAAEKYRESDPELASYFDGQAEYHTYLYNNRIADVREREARNVGSDGIPDAVGGAPTAESPLSTSLVTQLSTDYTVAELQGYLDTMDAGGLGRAEIEAALKLRTDGEAVAGQATAAEWQDYLDKNPDMPPETRAVVDAALGISTVEEARVAEEQRQTEPHVPSAGSTSDVAALFARSDSGTKPGGQLRREQGTTDSWYNISELEDDSGINLVGSSYKQTGENTFVADGTVSMGNGTARVQTTYTRNPDGTITKQSRLINHYQDDAPGAGGGGGGGDSREYTVADDGTVSYTEGDHTYTVRDEALAQDVLDAVASGDASGLGSADQVTVSDDSGNVVAGNANIEVPGGSAPLTVVSRDSNDYTTVRTAEGMTVYDPDGNYVASLDSEGGEIETPAGTPPSLAVAIDSIQQSASDGSTKVEVTGVTAADKLTLEDLRPEIAPNVAEIATYALPESSYGGSKGYYDFTAEELEALNLPPDATPADIKTAVDAYNAENPPEATPVGSVITEAQAVAWGDPNLAGQIVTEVGPDGTIWSRPESPPVGSVITEAQAVAWGDPNLAGQTITEVGPDGTITVRSAAESPIESPPVGSVITEAQAALWGDPALAGRTVTKVDPDGTVWSINQGEEQAVADFKSDVATKYMGPDEYTRLAEKWATNPDNALVQLPVYGETDDGYGLLGYQTPSEYFSQMATDPTVVANEAIFEQQRRELPGETGYIGTQVQVDPVTGTLQVSQGVAAIANAQREERERQEMTLPGETGVIGTQVQMDPVTGTLQVSPGVAPIVNAQREERERQEMTLPGETGVIGTQVQVDPVTGILQVSPGVAAIANAQREERERQEMTLPGETGVIGNQVQVDRVTGTLQVSPGVMPAVAAAQAAMPQEGDLGLIGGDLNIPLDIDGVERLKSNMATIRAEAEGAGVASDPANLEAQQTRLDRINNGEIFTIDDVKAANPGISDEDAKERVLYEAVLDIFAGNLIDDIGSIELYNALRSRGFNPVDAGEYSKKAYDDGLTTISDLVAVAGAVGGAYVGAFVAPRLVPVFTSSINPRLTTGVLRGGVEEVGEETGELIADVIHTAVTGGNPVAILLDPMTYAYAGGSILFSSVAEADSPGVRPDAAAIPNGAVGAGAVYSLGGRLDPTVAADGNRLLDRRAASRQELDKYLNDPRPEGVDLNTWNLRGKALASDVSNADTALTDFRLRNPNLVVGYKSGGTLTAATATNLIAVVPPDGNIRVYTLPPGEAIFVPSSTETPDAVLPDGRPNTDPNDASSADNGVSVQPSSVPAVNPASVATAAPATTPETADPSTTPQVTPSPAPETTPAAIPSRTSAVTPAPTLAPIPSATFVVPLPQGKAVPSIRQQQAAPTLTSLQPASPGGRSAPPTVVPPGSPTPGPPTPTSSPRPDPQPQPQPQPQPEPTPTPQVTPTPTPDPTGSLPGTGPGPGPGPGPGTLPQPQPQPEPGTLTGPTVTPQVSLPQPQPQPQPEPQVHPEPQTQPQPATLPTTSESAKITPTSNPTKLGTPNPKKPTPERRRGRSGDETPRLREIPNPVADDPNLHPQEIQYTEVILHTVQLPDGEHTIEPLDDSALRTAKITAVGPADPRGNIHRAGSVVIEPKERGVLLQTATRRRDANLKDPTEAEVAGPAGSGRERNVKIKPTSKAAKSAGKIGFRSGQGLVAQPAAANDGVLKGNGGKRRRGGSGRRKPEDEEETGPPQINLVFNPRG